MPIQHSEARREEWAVLIGVLLDAAGGAIRRNELAQPSD
jgi:hypothetical protein